MKLIDDLSDGRINTGTVTELWHKWHHDRLTVSLITTYRTTQCVINRLQLRH